MIQSQLAAVVTAHRHRKHREARVQQEEGLEAEACCVAELLLGTAVQRYFDTGASTT